MKLYTSYGLASFTKRQFPCSLLHQSQAHPFSRQRGNKILPLDGKWQDSRRAYGTENAAADIFGKDNMPHIIKSFTYFLNDIYHEAN